MLGAAPNVEWKRKRKNSPEAGQWGGGGGKNRRRPAAPTNRPAANRTGARPKRCRRHRHATAVSSPPREAPPPKPPTDRLGARDAIIATHVLIHTVHERRRCRRRCGDRRRRRRDSGLTLDYYIVCFATVKLCSALAFRVFFFLRKIFHYDTRNDNIIYTYKYRYVIVEYCKRCVSRACTPLRYCAARSDAFRRSATAVISEPQ